MTIAAIASTVATTGVVLSPEHLFRYALVVGVVAALRASCGAIRGRRPGFYLFMLHGMVHVMLLVPFRGVALVTPSDNRWGTR